MVRLQNGQCYHGDVLVGADGIRSKVSRINIFLEISELYGSIDLFRLVFFFAEKFR